MNEAEVSDHSDMLAESLKGARQNYTLRNGLPDALTVAEQGMTERFKWLSQVGGRSVNAQPFCGTADSVVARMGDLYNARTAAVSVKDAIGYLNPSVGTKIGVDLTPDLSKRPNFTPSNVGGSGLDHG